MQPALLFFEGIFFLKISDKRQSPASTQLFVIFVGVSLAADTRSKP
jgi:hypothetical protein